MSVSHIQDQITGVLLLLIIVATGRNWQPNDFVSPASSGITVPPHSTGIPGTSYAQPATPEGISESRCSHLIEIHPDESLHRYTPHLQIGPSANQRKHHIPSVTTSEEGSTWFFAASSQSWMNSTSSFTFGAPATLMELIGFVTNKNQTSTDQRPHIQMTFQTR